MTLAANLPCHLLLSVTLNRCLADLCSLLFCLLQQWSTKKNWYIGNAERLVSCGKCVQTQDSRVCYSKRKALQQNGAQQSWRKHHFQFLEKLPQKTAFSSNLANTKFWKFLENQNPRTISEAQALEQRALPGSCSCPGGHGLERRWISLTAAGAKVSRPYRAATLAELDTCKTVLSLLGRTQMCALAQEHRNTLSPSLNQSSEGFHTRSLILPVSGNLRSIAARGFTAACPKILWCSSTRQL